MFMSMAIATPIALAEPGSNEAVGEPIHLPTQLRIRHLVHVFVAAVHDGDGVSRGLERALDDVETSPRQPTGSPYVARADGVWLAPHHDPEPVDRVPPVLVAVRSRPRVESTV